MLKGYRFFLIRQRRLILIFVTGKVRLSEHLDVAAKGDNADFPAGARFIVPSEQFGPETDGKNFNPHLGQPGDPEMPKLMEENQNRKRDKEGKAPIQGHINDVHEILSTRP